MVMIDLSWLRDLVHAQAWWVIFFSSALNFALIYFSSAGLTWWLTRHVLSARGIGHIIDRRALRPGQIFDEVRQSLVSILIFAAYGVATVAADGLGLVHIRWWETPGRFVLDLGLLILWNEIHFYACHRLLHTQWLYRHVHAAHHRSVVSTPFSTYSLHWFEALLLSGVTLLFLLVYDLGIACVLMFPFISLALNSIGHMNYELFPQRPINSLLTGCRRHSLHHGRCIGNYGFSLPWLDHWLNTSIKGLDREVPLPPDDHSSTPSNQC